MRRPKMLFVGDAGVPTGFARASHAYLAEAVKRYDVTVCGVNYRGDPHEHPYPIYLAAAGGDAFGVGRLIWMCDLVRKSVQDGQRRRYCPREADHGGPDVIVIQNDPWNFPFYVNQLRKAHDGYEKEFAHVPIVGIVAVDGLNCLGEKLNGLAMAIFWTEFGRKEAQMGGYRGPSCVIPLGVDLETYHPMDKVEARRLRGMAPELDNAFIVGNVNRNQPRKRLDLTIRSFAKWVHSGTLKDAYLYLHIAPTSDMGVDAMQLARYYGIAGRTCPIEPLAHYGASEAEMRHTYNCFDVQISTTQGEGFGLTTLEGMACGVPQFVPDWAALGEWAAGAAMLAPIGSTAMNMVAPGLNTIGGVPSERALIEGLNALYRNKALRADLQKRGLELAADPRYRWENIASDFVDAVDMAIGNETERGKVLTGEFA